jgi:membrane fusion protein
MSMGEPRRPDDPLFRPEAVAEQQGRWLGSVLIVPRPSWTLMAAVVSVLVTGLFGLLLFGEYTRKARLAGLLAPERGLIQVVSPLAGVVTEVRAKEGLEVAAGTPLAVLSAERRSEAFGATQGEVLRALRVRRDSLVAERERHRALFAAQVSAHEARLAVTAAGLIEMKRELDLQKARVSLADDALARQRELRARDLVVENNLREAEEDVLDQRLALQSLERQRATLERSRLELQAERDEAPLRADLQDAEIDRQIAQIEQELAEAEAARELVIVAPQAGTLSALRVSAGGGVAAEEPLMTLVPAGARLEARLYGPSRAIGFVRPGQKVLLRYDAYPHQKFGHYGGTVTSVSRVTVNPVELAGLTAAAGGSVMLGETSEPAYRVTVALDEQTATAYGAAASLQPGMTVQADVLIETRRVYQWVLDPLHALTGSGSA